MILFGTCAFYVPIDRRGDASRYPRQCMRKSQIHRSLCFPECFHGPRLLDCGMDIGDRKSVYHVPPYLYAPLSMLSLGCDGRFVGSMVCRAPAPSACSNRAYTAGPDSAREQNNFVISLGASARGVVQPTRGLGFIILLGVWQLRRQTCCLQRSHAICWKKTTIRATTRRTPATRDLGINCIPDELPRSRFKTCHWGEHEARVWETRQARGTFRLEGGLATVRKTFPCFIVYRRGRKNLLYPCFLVVNLFSLF